MNDSWQIKERLIWEANPNSTCGLVVTDTHIPSGAGTKFKWGGLGGAEFQLLELNEWSGK